MSLGNRVLQLRLEAGLSQSQLAGRLDVSASAISKWESSVFTPGVDSLILLSESFGVTLDWLILGSNRAHRNGRILLGSEPLWEVPVPTHRRDEARAAA